MNISDEPHAIRVLPPLVKRALTNAARNPTRQTVNAAGYWLRRHQNEVRIFRAKVDARIDQRREEYQARGLSPDHRGFITTAMRESLELIYALEAGVGIAVEELKRLKAKVEGHGA